MSKALVNQCQWWTARAIGFKMTHHLLSWCQSLQWKVLSKCRIFGKLVKILHFDNTVHCNDCCHDSKWQVILKPIARAVHYWYWFTNTFDIGCSRDDQKSPFAIIRLAEKKADPKSDPKSDAKSDSKSESKIEKKNVGKSKKKNCKKP